MKGRRTLEAWREVDLEFFLRLAERKEEITGKRLDARTVLYYLAGNTRNKLLISKDSANYLLAQMVDKDSKV